MEILLNFAFGLAILAAKIESGPRLLISTSVPGACVMKRLLGLTFVVLAVLSVSLSHLSIAAGPPRVHVCHLVTATTHPNGSTTVVGHVIEVPLPAVSFYLPTQLRSKRDNVRP